MATIKEQIVLEIKGLCRNKACAELAADIAIRTIDSLKTLNNSKINYCNCDRYGAVHKCSKCGGDIFVQTVV